VTSPGRLPTFIVVGAQKAGTSSLHAYLSRHPAVAVSRPKETHYFTDQVHRARDRRWYVDQFRGPVDAAAIGETSPSYTSYPSRLGVAQRIHEAVPDVRLVYLLRHPVDRAISGYQLAVRHGWERRPLDAALREDNRYLVQSLYGAQIEELLRWFPREALLTVLSTDLRDHRARTVDAVFAHVGVEALAAQLDLDVEHNVTAGKRAPNGLARLAHDPSRVLGAVGRLPRPMAAVTRRAVLRPLRERERVASADTLDLVRQRLRGDLERLATFLGTPADPWGLLS